MLRIGICQRVFVLPFISVIMLAGCAGTLDERRQMKSEGQALYSHFRKDCYDEAWWQHPTDFQLVSVTRSRSIQVHSGMDCVTDEYSANRQICSNTYRTEPEYYTTQETQDRNKGYRDHYFSSCLTERCNAAVGADAKGESFLTLRGQKYSYCKRG